MTLNIWCDKEDFEKILKGRNYITIKRSSSYTIGDEIKILCGNIIFKSFITELFNITDKTKYYFIPNPNAR